MTFLETVMGEYHRMQSRRFAGQGYEGVTHAGIALVAADTGLVLLAQRAPDPTDEPDVAETWEFPGGGIEPGEDPFNGAMREFSEEIGWVLPEDMTVVNGWRSENGVYQGFVVATNTAFDLSDWTPTEECQGVGWVHLDDLPDGMILRPEMEGFDISVLDAAVVGQTKETDMSETAPEDDLSGVEGLTSTTPVLSMADVMPRSIPIHGVVAPEGKESGDARAFNEGAMTSRPLRLPFSWQKASLDGHTGSVVVGSVDRLMRQGGLIHWEGSLMCGTEESDEFFDLLTFFDQFGVSVDGDRGSVDATKTKATEVLWFDAVRMAGLTAVAIPAFAEAYVALGPHPDMPPAGSAEEDALVASGMQFGRGPGWVTNPEDTARLHRYWTEKGQPGYEKIRWGVGGDFDRCVAMVGEEVGESSPEKLRFIKAQCAQWHHDALGYWPSTHKKMIDKGVHAASESDLDFAAEKYTSEQRKKMAEAGHALPDGSFPIGDAEDLQNAIQAIGRAKDPAKAKAFIKKRAADLGKTDLIPETWGLEGGALEVQEELFGEAYEAGRISEVGEREDGAIIYDLADANPSISADTEGMGWEAVLVSSATGAHPPIAYFNRHPDTGATVVDDPDEFGFRRTYGYAAEWGVCHIGYDGRCVGVPPDPTGGDYPEFHLGRTKTDEGYVHTGVITYKTVHRDAKTILSESAEQAHYDNIEHAWAAVRIGEDDHGVWFSGVVLPHIPDEDIVLIEAAGQVSGEWKFGALRGLQSVNIPGFPVMRSSAEYDEDGNVIALAASAFGTSECEPTPAERLSALRQIDAEVRFSRLKQEWVD